MTYLDDPDHDWSIDPSSEVNDLDLDQVISDLKHRLACPCLTCTLGNEMALELILKGALELARRTDAPLARCLDTSMIWYYG